MIINHANSMECVVAIKAISPNQKGKLFTIVIHRKGLIQFLWQNQKFSKK